MNDIFSIETGNNFHADHRFRLIQQGLRVIINYYKRRAEGVVHIKSNEKFTQRAELAIENARAAAGELGHGYVGTEHLLLGILLEEGLGDTIRVSLTDAPEREVKVGLEILRALGLRAPGPSVTSCPTCGRTKVDVVGVAAAVEEALERLVRTDAARGRKLPRVAVMGCVVNGPGEAKGADVALCGGAREFLLYVGGRPAGKVRPEDAVAAVLSAVRGLMSEEAKG